MEECSIFYFWTSASPASKNINNIISGSKLADVITTVCVDCPKVRNLLIYGKNQVPCVPSFVVCRNGVCDVYDSTRTEKALYIAKQLLNDISASSLSSDQTIDGFRLVSRNHPKRDVSKISRIETDDEDGLLRSSKV